MKSDVEINGNKYVNSIGYDLRFTGYEDECIIVDRTKNHYLVPIGRYREIKIDSIIE